jgi:hypothetical protein
MNFDFSIDDSSSSEEDEKVKYKQGDFTGLCLMGKSLRNISDSDVSDDLSPKSLFLESSSLKTHCAIRISYFTRFFMRTKS